MNLESISSLTVIAGDNFSGRSDFLKSRAFLNEKRRSDFLFLGEQPSNFISGIFPTVKSEVNFHSIQTSKEILRTINGLLGEYSFDKHYGKNPFTLSGGEQTILVILSALLLQPQELAIDSTLEQLNEEWRRPLLTAIQEGFLNVTNVFLSDNRVKEYHLYNSILTHPNVEDKKYKYSFEKPSNQYEIRPCSNPQTVEITNLSFAYNKKENILNNINVYLESGKIYHLTGQNGAGKTTLAKLFTGILKYESGCFRLAGKDYDSYKYPGHLAGYSFQNPDEQIFSPTVEDEILRPLRKEPTDYTRRRECFINMFGLQNIRKCHPAELPFVIRKRISLAATLATDRPWYILDEPTLGQDDSFVEFLVALVNSLAAKGYGIIVISHSNSFTDKLKGKKLNLSAGKLIF